MKKIFTLIASVSFMLLLHYDGQSQNSIYAKEILQDIKSGNDQVYQNVTILGDLDLTYYFEKRGEEKYASKNKWRSNDNVVEEIIDVQLVFENCTFDEGIIAYYHDERSEFTFTASFKNSVVFRNCEFKEIAAFKYSEFDKGADFGNTTFHEDANFKYAEFVLTADFSNTVFEELANFKYAKFHKGLAFTGAQFQEDLNLKYAHIDGDFASGDMDIQRDLDVKYTEVNGENFSKHLLKTVNK